MIQRVRKMSENYILVAMATDFLQFKVIFRKNPEISKDCLAIFH